MFVLVLPEHHSLPIFFDSAEKCQWKTLLQGVQKGVELSTHDLNLLESPPLLIRKVQVDHSLWNQYHSGEEHLSQPSETLCTHIHGLQVAVTVDLEGDPLGRNILGLQVSAPAIVVVAEVVGIVEVTAGVGVKVVLPVVTNWHLPRKF